MEVLGVGAEPRAGVVEQDPPGLLGKRGGRGHATAARRPGGAERPGRHLELERAEHLRPQLGGRRAGAPELLLEPPQGLLVAPDELDLELAEAVITFAPASTETESSTISAPSAAHALAPRAEARDRPELATAQEADEQGGELERRPRGRAGLLELDPRRPARELQLPEPVPASTRCLKRDAVPGEHEIRGVVVGRGEAPGRKRLAAELRQDESLVGGELHLALELLLHPASVTRTSRSGTPRPLHVSRFG